MDLQRARVERTVLSGTRGPDTMVLGCLEGGGFGLLRNGIVIRAWPADKVGSSLRTFLRLIEPSDHGVVGTMPRPMPI